MPVAFTDLLQRRARLRRENIGFVFQTFNLVPYLTAQENVLVPMFLAEVDEQRKFFLKFPNDKEIVDIDRIVGFLARIAKRYNKPEELSRYMREYAFHKMDWGVKMKKYVEFCRQV